MEVRRFRAVTLFVDIVVLAISFLIVISTKPSGLKGYLPSHSIFFGGLALIWIAVSLLNGKMHKGRIINYSTLFNRVIISNIIALSLTALLMYTVREVEYSRTVVLGTAIVATFLELVIGTLYITYKKAHIQDYENYADYKALKKKSEHELVAKADRNGKNKTDPEVINPRVLLAIENESGPEAARAIIKMAGIRLNARTAVLSTTTVFNISNLPDEKLSLIHI